MRTSKDSIMRLGSLLLAGSLCLLLVIAVANLFAPKVFALSNVAPDPNDFGRVGVDFTLSNTHDVANSSSMALTVYHAGTAKPGNLAITVSYQGGSKTGANQNSQGFGQVRFNGGATANPGSFVIPITAWRQDSSGQGYEATFTAALVDQSQSGDDSNHINFALSTTGGYIIGPNGGSQFAVEQAGYCWDGHNCAKYHEYQLPFAPDCSVSKGGTAAVSIYDMDNGNPVIQPKHLKVQVKDITTNTIVNNDKWTGSEGNGATAKFSFTYSPAHKYKALLLDVNANNILQITLPFDSVNYALDCSSSSGGGGGSGGGPASCPNLSVSPSGDIPIGKSFSVTATGAYTDATTAKTVYKNGGRAYYVLQNSAGTTVASTSGGAVSGSSITGRWTVPGQPGGVYTLSGGVAGGSGDESCSEQITVADHPYFSVIGGDIAAGAGFDNGIAACKQASSAGITGWNNGNSTDYPNYNGAGARLAALALGNITSFVSGQGSINAPYRLSFANFPTPGAPNYGGNFGSLPCLPDYASKITSKTVWTGSYTSSGLYKTSGSITLGATPLLGIPPNTVINLKVNGDVYINGNITYNDSAGPGHYPRLDLIATGSIYIAPGVTQLHGLYVAQGTTGSGEFVTCASGIGAEQTDYNTCGHNQLTVYGAVAAKILHLDRSFGDARLNNGPAETFVYSPELWLATPECTVIANDPACGAASGTLEWDAVSILPPTL